MNRSVVVTGVGILSACGATGADHLAAFRTPKRPDPNLVTFAPYTFFPVAPFDEAAGIPSRSDRRQMEPWQILGVSAAKLAIDAAGLSGTSALETLYLNLAANGGAREQDVDLSVLADLRGADDPMAHLVAALAKRIRPSFLLGQLPNMLAGNIAIVLGVGGGARTFMGEEYAGAEAFDDAVARIAAGQSDRILVGGVFDAARIDLILSMVLGDRLVEGMPLPVFAPARRGQAPGTLAAFVVLEDDASARARGADAMARIAGVQTAWGADIQSALTDCIQALPGGGTASLILSGASGLHPNTTYEGAALHAMHPDTPVWAISDMVGYGREAAFPFQMALAALCLHAGAEDKVLVSNADGQGIAAALLERAP